MTDCQALDRDLTAYLSGELAPERSLELEEHATRCERCHPLLERASRLPWTLPVSLDPPTEVRAHLLSAVRAPSRSNRHYRWLLPIAAAAVLFLATTLGPVTKSGQSPAIDPTATLVAAGSAAEFKKLDAARAEVVAEIAKRPADAHLQAVLKNLDARRRELTQVVRKFKS